MLDWIVPNILGPLVVFGLVVFVHELGHFLAAKAVGVYAPRFSIGFGPALWRKRWGETEYVIAAIPLGGYVRMASRLDQETSFLEGGGEAKKDVPTVGADGVAKIADEEYPEGWDPEALVPFGPKPVPENRWFESKSLPARLLILIAGVAMNVLLTLGLLVGLFAARGQEVPVTRVVGAVDSALVTALPPGALQPGDTLRSVEGRAPDDWEDVVTAIAEGTGPIVRLETQRGPVEIPVGPGGAVSRERLAGALLPAGRTEITMVEGGSPAARAGLEAGDVVRAIDGTRLLGPGQFVEVVSRAPGRPLTAVVEREGARRTLVLRPDSVEGEGGAVRGRVGAGIALAFDETVRERLSFGEALEAGWERTWQLGGLIFDVLGRIGTGDVSVRELGGPGTIAIASAQAARGGLETFIGLIAFLSINVAIFNLLPIPLLDGGQIVLNVIETARGSAFSPRTREAILRVGLVAIALLFAIVLFNDTTRIVGAIRGIWD